MNSVTTAAVRQRRPAQPLSRGRSEVFGVLAAAAIGLVMVLLHQAMLSARAESHRTETLVTAEQLARRIEEWSDARTRSLEVLRTHIETDLNPDHPEFEARYRELATSYLYALPDFQAINWVEPDGRIRLVVPLAGNEAALGRDLSRNPNPSVREALGNAARNGQTSRTLATISLLQGGHGFAAYVPVAVDGPAGFINAVFRIDALLAACLSEETFTEHFEYRLLEADGEVVARRESADGSVDGEWFGVELQLVDRPLWLLLRPASAMLADGDLPLLHIMLAIGIAVAAGLGVLLTLGLRRHALISASQQRYRSLFDHAPHAYLETAADGRIRAVNEALVRLTGFPAAELIGRSMLDLYVPGQQGRDRAAALFRAFEAGEPIDNERLELRTRDDDRRIVLLSAESGTRNDDDHDGGDVRSALVDITALDAAERADARREAWLRALLDSAPVGILSVAQDGTILTANRHAAAMLAERPDQLPGEPFRRFFQPGRQWRERVASKWPEALTGQPQPEWVARALDGTVRRIRMGIGEPETDGEHTSGWVCTLQDLSEIEQLEAQLLQAQKMEAIGTLAGGIAHDFNNLLQVISAACELLEARADRSDEDDDSLALIRRSTLRASELVQQLLVFSRQQKLSFERLDLRTVVEEAVTMLRGTIPAHISIAHSLPARPVLVEGSQTQLLQVVMNLGINAFQALEAEGGSFTLTLRADLDEAELVFEDDGPGMSQDVLDKIFTPFFSTKDVGKGSGLGLATAHGTVLAHGGSITAESTPGEGAVFRIRLPLADGEPAMAAVAGATNVSAAVGRRVLLVDDEDMVLQTLTRGLERLGLEVVPCISPQAALDRLADPAQTFDAIVSDYSMPGMQGDELLRRAGLLRPGIHRVLCSGYRHAADSLQGVADVLVDKPVGMAVLAGAVLQGVS